MHVGELCGPTRHVKRLGQRARYSVKDDAQVRPPHRAISDQLIDNILHHVHRNGETNAHVTARAAHDRRVDADELASDIDEGPAGVSRVNSSICLDQLRKKVDAGGDLSARPVLCADNTGSHSVFEVFREGRAEGEGPLPDLQRIVITKRDGVQAVGIDVDDGQVASRVCPHHLGRVVTAIKQADLQVVGVLYHVIIRDDMAIGGRDDTGPKPGPDLIFSSRRAAEEVLKRRTLKRTAASLHHLLRPDLHDRPVDPVGHLHKGFLKVQDGAIRVQFDGRIAGT